MITITQRPVFDFEKRAYLQTLKPQRDLNSLIPHYGWWYFLLPLFAGGLISRILLWTLPLSEDAAVIAGLITAYIGSVCASLKVKQHRRSVYEREKARLENTIIETLEIEARRAWALDQCSCCSRSYLFQVGDTELVFLETLNRTEAELRGVPARRMEIERDRDTKMIWGIRSDGPPIIVEELHLENDDLLADSFAECEVLKLDELPEVLRAKVAAS